MLTKTVHVQVEVPEAVSAESRQTAERQAHEAAVLALFQAGDLSTRVAAEELGLQYHEFLDLLADRGIPVSQGPFDTEALEQARAKLAEGRTEGRRT